MPTVLRFLENGKNEPAEKGPGTAESQLSAPEAETHYRHIPERRRSGDTSDEVASF